MNAAPWSCLYCLFGLCRLCTGRVTVQRIDAPARDVPCGHEHPATGPAARVLAATPHYARVVE